jgi:hypothetical protein
MLFAALSIILAVKDRSDIATRQLLRDIESHNLESYGKSLMLKILPLLSPQDRDWMRGLY